jgi:threonine/homoserine/homoserine lactone efflux protein
VIAAGGELLGVPLWMRGIAGWALAIGWYVVTSMVDLRRRRRRRADASWTARRRGRRLPRRRPDPAADDVLGRRSRGLGSALVLAVLGLAALAETFHWAFLVVKYCGVAYLLYLAWQMWRAPLVLGAGRIAPRGGQPLRMFLAGLTVTLGNPKIMAFYLALLPTIIDLGGVGALGLLELALTMLAVLAAVDIAWIALAERARRLLTSPRALRAANRVSATLMGGAAAAIAAR